MLELFASIRIYWVASILGLALIVRFLQRLYQQRKLCRNLPGPPHSWIFGHLATMGPVLATQPSTAAFQTLCWAMKEKYNLPDQYYLDVWPFSYPMLMIMDSSVAHEIMVKNSLPKHQIIGEWMTNFGGPGNLVSSEGSLWKKWRATFNPGFSASHLMTLVPAIVEQTQVFQGILENRARNQELFRMEQATTKLTVDIIGKVVLDISLDSQNGPNELLDAFNSQTRWQAIGAQFRPSELWDIRRPIIQRYNVWVMDNYISKRLDARFNSREGRGKTKHVIDLALEEYLKEVKGSTTGDISKVKSLDPEFKRGAINNMKTFVFAGHDTTSSTICYAYYYLNKYPSTLSKIRSELDQVFGPISSSSSSSEPVSTQLIANPHLLSKLEYTLAVTREVLRLQPPASSLRKGNPNFILHDPETGESLPTEGFMLYPVNVGLHRNPKYWSDPHTFNPERFLANSQVKTGDDKEAYFPFSKGPRNCIGQELALIETKVILAMTVREFDFKPAYDELEKLKGDGSGYHSVTTGIQEQFGDEAYQIQLGTAKPREGMPCRVSLRKGEGIE